MIVVSRSEKKSSLSPCPPCLESRSERDGWFNECLSRRRRLRAARLLPLASVKRRLSVAAPSAHSFFRFFEFGQVFEPDIKSQDTHNIFLFIANGSRHGNNQTAGYA